MIAFTLLTCLPNREGNRGIVTVLAHSQLSKQESPGHPRQVDFPSRQATFHSHLPDGQGIRQVLCRLNHSKNNLRLAQGRCHLRYSCLKAKFFQVLAVLINLITSHHLRKCSQACCSWERQYLLNKKEQWKSSSVLVEGPS